MRKKTRLRFLLRLVKSKLRKKTLSVANSAATAGRAVMSQSAHWTEEERHIGDNYGNPEPEAPSPMGLSTHLHTIVATWELQPSTARCLGFLTAGRYLYFKFKPPNHET